LIYKYLGGISAFIYEPTNAPIPDKTNVNYAATASSDDMVVTTSGDPEVLGYSDYTFAFSSGNDITTDDYVAF
jgi:hypothetical protein